MDVPPVLRGFDPTLLLVLNLAGTFVFGLSGGLAAAPDLSVGTLDIAASVDGVA